MPYRGLEKTAEGKKTILTLYEDKFDYKFKIAQEIRLTHEDNPKDKKEAIYYSDEQGVVDKDKISSIVKYIETDYDVDVKPFIKHFVSVVFFGGEVIISFEEEKDKHKIYEELYNWKYNLK